MGGWVTTKTPKPPDPIKPASSSGWVGDWAAATPSGGGGASVASGGIQTFPIGQDLVGFESLTPSQKTASSTLQSLAIQGAKATPTFKYPAFQTPAAPIKAPTVPSLAPTPITMPPFEYEGINPADVGNIQDILATLPGLSPEVKQTLNTLMQGAGASPEQTLEEILASIPTFGGDLGEETRSALAKALKGEFPEEYFQTSIAEPTRKTFEEELAPAIREEFVGPGTFWGGERAGAVTEQRGKMESNLAVIRGELGNQAQQRTLEAVATSVSARQNQISLAMQELTSQRDYANAKQITALNAAIAEIEHQESNVTAAQNELNRLSEGKYREIALATERWGTEVDVLRQQQELAQGGKIEEARLGQEAWQTSVGAQLEQQAQAQALYTTNMQTAYDNFMRNNPAQSEFLQTILAYLNTPMLAAYQPYA